MENNAGEKNENGNDVDSVGQLETWKGEVTLRLRDEAPLMMASMSLLDHGELDDHVEGSREDSDGGVEL